MKVHMNLLQSTLMKDLNTKGCFQNVILARDTCQKTWLQKVDRFISYLFTFYLSFLHPGLGWSDKKIATNSAYSFLQLIAFVLPFHRKSHCLQFPCCPSSQFLNQDEGFFFQYGV